MLSVDYYSYAGGCANKVGGHSSQEDDIVKWIEAGIEVLRHRFCPVARPWPLPIARQQALDNKKWKSLHIGDSDMVQQAKVWPLFEFP